MNEEMELDTDSLYLALAEKILYSCFREEKKQDKGIVAKQILFW